MSSAVIGFDDLEQLTKEVQEALQALESLDASISADLNDLSSVEAAIAEAARCVDAKLAPYHGNPWVEQIAGEAKELYTKQLIALASESRTNMRHASNSHTLVDQAILRQIENTTTDLRSSDGSSFGRHIKKLSRLLHDPRLAKITDELTSGIDFDKWLDDGLASSGSMVGSGELTWPADHEKELGTTILLIDRFASNPDWATDFSLNFFYSGNNIARNLQHMVGQILVPFVRDYIAHVTNLTGASEATLLPVATGPASRKAFVVHGHDEGARESVARLLEKLNFEAVILHERANQGLTVIEKIEAHSDVGFAVVLLTPDDVGAQKGHDLQPRARQNVLLELGYFIGRLGRARVCALTRGDVEIPSDFRGVVYVPLDEGGAWRTTLANELQSAGFEIDWNVVMGRSRSSNLMA